MATKPSALDKGIEYITQAVDHDVKARYADAYKAYMMGLDYMLLALKWEKNPKVNTMIRSKISEYLDRTETIKRFLDSTANQTSTHKPSDHNGWYRG
ncbi:hypothetical protein CPB83DRAFT_606063 [Crepidotus variabilis]|uniref:vesicle-fusing ATPase n=1 Tax=Crepidotus variabilis TaxID=179855 RepID=A0A9P6E8S9_9AGAR|nr:hypothetical protein CPB83DRAFT_606063 [Crepidotus variabilis]